MHPLWFYRLVAALDTASIITVQCIVNISMPGRFGRDARAPRHRKTSWRSAAPSPTCGVRTTPKERIRLPATLPALISDSITPVVQNEARAGVVEWQTQRT